MSGAVYVVGIAGGTGSGKTTLAKQILKGVGEDRAAVLPQDAYYRDFGHLTPKERAGVNFDHPDALETPLLVAHLDALAGGEEIEAPVYDFSTHTRQQDTAVRAALGLIVAHLKAVLSG